MHPVDYVIVLAYMGFAIGVGFWYSRKAAKDSEAFFLGGRSLPWWAICLSMIATSFASDTPIWVTEVTRADGLQRMWWVIVAVLPLIVGIFLFSRLWRRAEIITDAQFYEMRYAGKPAAFLRAYRALSSGVIQNLLTIAWVTFAMSKVITVLTPFNEWEAILVCMLVALFYATFSGFYGVVATDVVQFFITMGSMTALAWISVVKSGGMDAVLGQVRANPDYGAGTLALFPDFSTFNADVLKMMVYFLVIWWSDASGYNMQRMSACRNEKDAIRATLFYAIFQSCRPWLWVVVGLVSIVAFPALESNSDAYPMVINAFLGPGMKGLLITAFLAAFMSTIDTHLNWGASYLTTDIYKRFIRRDADPKYYVFVSKFAMLVLMTGGVLLVPMLNSVTEAMESLAYMLICGGIVSVLRWFWWRVNAYTEITAYLGGLVGWLVFILIGEDVELFGQTWGTLAFEFKIALLVAVVLPLSIVVTYATKPVPRETLTRFYLKVRPGGFWGPVRAPLKQLSGQALGPGTLIDVIGGVLLCYGLSLATAYAILLQFSLSLICLAVALLGAGLVYRWYRTEAHRLGRHFEPGPQPEGL